MRYLRNIEDENGDLVELVCYCSWLCYAGEPDAAVAALPGGAWPCLDSELEVVEHCRGCGSSIGPAHGKPLGPGSKSRVSNSMEPPIRLLRQRMTRTAS